MLELKWDKKLQLKEKIEIQAPSKVRNENNADQVEFCNPLCLGSFIAVSPSVCNTILVVDFQGFGKQKLPFIPLI